MMVNNEHYILLIKLLYAAVPHRGQDEPYILLITLLCAAVPYGGQQ